MDERFERCKARVLGHLDVLLGRVRCKQINMSAVEGLIDSFIDQPGYSGFRQQLRDTARAALARAQETSR